MSYRDEGLYYGGLWLMFAACEPLRPKVEAMKEYQFKPRWRFIEVGHEWLELPSPSQRKLIES